MFHQPGPVGGHVQARVVLPQRGQHRLPDAALEQPALAGHPVLDGGDPQLGAVPGHVRVIPRDPGQPAAVGRRGREREEVRAGDQGPDRRRVGRRRAVQRDGHDRAGDGAAVVALQHAPDLRVARREHEVGVAQRAGRQRPGARAGRHLRRVGGQRRAAAPCPPPSPGRPGTAAGRRSWRRRSPGPAAGPCCPARAGRARAGRTARRTRARGSARSTGRAAAPCAGLPRPGT